MSFIAGIMCIPTAFTGPSGFDPGVGIIMNYCFPTASVAIMQSFDEAKFRGTTEIIFRDGKRIFAYGKPARYASCVPIANKNAYRNAKGVYTVCDYDIRFETHPPGLKEAYKVNHMKAWRDRPQKLTPQERANAVMSGARSD